MGHVILCAVTYGDFHDVVNDSWIIAPDGTYMLEGSEQ